MLHSSLSSCSLAVTVVVQGLSRSQRQLNLTGTFAVPQEQRHRIANQSLLLIDVVMTTGATIYDAARTLHRAGSGPVRGLVLARVLRHGL